MSEYDDFMTQVQSDEFAAEYEDWVKTLDEAIALQLS